MSKTEDQSWWKKTKTFLVNLVMYTFLAIGSFAFVVTLINFV